ncbi:trypsin-like peptidase domain-containing protein [Corynebacterium sp. CCUG 65737]|uniref:trypsin-like serine peptidase n=1 Tax=unclassified Corynebacterium TaxID=2624378 RepID=UPI002109D659|nr:MULTISPECIES: serine protease [unclassified Corynebacterium]MCQ4624747.1 trypsin-like peptidase domain-containing protein [Corynebacterium sp. CCUG 69979]MCQ4627176.1 trypsin-like peptidase domain-containing protein [Corynebacterium sp. CCUG 65737]
MFPASLVRISSGAAYCSGTLLDPETVLTCAHFFREHPTGATVKAHGAIRTIRQVRAVPGTDIAIVTVRPFRKLSAETFPRIVEGAAPRIGTPAVTFGFGGRARRMQARPGLWLGTIPMAMSRSRATRVRPAGLVFNTKPAVKGDSGGPVMVGGRIVGVQSLILDPFGKNLRVATVNLLPEGTVR